MGSCAFKFGFIFDKPLPHLIERRPFYEVHVVPEQSFHEISEKVRRTHPVNPLEPPDFFVQFSDFRIILLNCGDLI
jgi:hypothetical protein